METIKIKYHIDEIDKIKEIAIGDWIASARQKQSYYIKEILHLSVLEYL